MPEEKKRLLVHCRVARGFFDQEWLVVVAQSSAFVSRENVKVRDVPATGDVAGLVWAYVVDSKDDQTLIELPGQPVVGGKRTWVPKSDLEAVSA